jgi:hypothetical protein
VSLDRAAEAASGEIQKGGGNNANCAISDLDFVDSFLPDFYHDHGLSDLAGC